MPAYLVLLRVEIAAFHPCRSFLPARAATRFRAAPEPSGLRPVATGLRRPRVEHPWSGDPARLVSVALIRTSRWTGVTRYAALRSPDFPLCDANVAQRSPGLLHTGILRRGRSAQALPRKCERSS